jgi:hypothetical protein
VATGATVKWIDVDVDDVGAHRGLVTALLEREVDGLTISNVMSAEECTRGLRALEASQGDRVPCLFGSMLGRPLAELPRWVDDPSDRTVYLEGARQWRSWYRAAFGFDPHDRVAGALEAMSDGKRVEPPTEGGMAYNPGNIRWYEPGGPGLPAHVGNEFAMHADGCLSHLSRVTETVDHLSYFVVLQSPEQGGALSVFDLEFGRHHPADPQWGEQGRNDRDFDSLPAHRVDPPPGSLVVFCGGRRWHRVDPVAGRTARVTYGGFGGPSRDGTAINLWF